MPEGPEIRRAADSLEAAVKGEPLTDVWFAFPQLHVYQAPLVGQRVTQIETRGKALLTHFSGGLIISCTASGAWWRLAHSRSATACCGSGCRRRRRRFCSIARRISTF